jgi:hypothetical protein
LTGPLRVADLVIGPVEAKIDAGEVAAYARATALDEPPVLDGTVPATFPSVWLWHPLAADAIATASGDGKRVPLLIAQRFEYHGPMSIGATYRFTIQRFTDPDDPALLAIEADVYGLDGAPVATVWASYRMVSLEDGAA